MYFTQDHEDAIVKYCSSECRKEKTHLYVRWIQPAFNEMVDKIVFTYKFTNLPNIDELREDCKVWLTTILEKYDPNRGSKAFSYFSVITKNWFIHKVKKNSKRAQREVDYEDAAAEISEKLVTPGDEYVSKQIDSEFWALLEKEIQSWSKLPMTENEKVVYDAIRTLFNSADELDILNKKAVYLYLREITGLNTKQIVSQLNKMRKRYRAFKNNWNNCKF
jgi:hypothetical protein